jgi:hypothetical protein
MSKLINSNNLMPCDSDCIYYLVREGYVSDPASFTWRAEGTCKKIRFISEMIDGSILIDGYFHHDLVIGDEFTVTSSTEHSLKCIRINHIWSG